MVDKEKDNNTSYEHDLLNIVGSLVDNLQDVNSANNETLKAINVSLIKVSDALPSLKSLPEKITTIENNTKEVSSIATNFKITVAIVGIIFTLGLTIIGLTISKAETNIIQGVTTKIEKMFDDHIGQIEQKTKELEAVKKQ